MKKLKELAKQHADHTVSYNPMEEASLDLERALEIYSSIGSRIGKTGNLYKSYTDSECAFSDDNAIMGILAKLLGFDDDASRIYEELRGWENNGLVSTIKSNNVFRTDANAYYSIFCKAMGKAKEAKKARGAICSEIGKLSNGLYADHLVEHKDGYRYSGGAGKTVHNAAMATLEATLGHREAETLCEKIADSIGRDGKLYLSCQDSFEKCEDNAAMMVACELVGKEEEAFDICNSLEEIYGTGCLLKSSVNAEPSTKESALAGIYHCLRGGKRLGKWKKG
ncbi:MAG: hypothetical protein HZB68_03120 [Candidatus Aenigmarchaeota archaeon]|nr:hypothetical protein [Candidatus Aenigmarchaeota archaeon]